MASSVTNFPHFPSPPPPASKPQPPPHVLPPPPPHITPSPPPPSPDNGPTVIIIVFISLGCLIFLAFLAIALFCFLKKMKKNEEEVEETEIVHVDEHLRVKEAIVGGPHGPQSVVLAVEDDVHVEEEIKKNVNFVEGKHVESADKISSDLEQGASIPSSSHLHDMEPKP